jgi:hypothetical protein
MSSAASCVWFTAIRIFWKNWADATRARVARAASSESAVFGEGRYDGALRNHFFP